MKVTENANGTVTLEVENNGNISVATSLTTEEYLNAPNKNNIVKMVAPHNGKTIEVWIDKSKIVQTKVQNAAQPKPNFEVALDYIKELITSCNGQNIEDIKLATAHKIDCLKWEQLMMELVGEDGFDSVREAITKLKENQK